MPSPITAVTGPLLDLELVPLPLPPAADGGQFRQLLADARERGTERPEPRSAADAPERRPAPEPVPRVWSPAADHTRPAHDAGPAAEPGSEAVQEDRDDATEGKVVNGADAVLADPGRTASTPTEAKPVVAAEGPATVPPAVQDLPGAGASPALPVIEGPDGPIDFAQLFPELVAPATPTEASDNLLLPTGSPMGPAVKQGPSADAGLVRQYRYGFGHGRPSLVTGPVNAKHLDRFGRDIFKLQAATAVPTADLAAAPTQAGPSQVASASLFALDADPITVPPPATATIEDAIDSPEPAAPVPPHDEPDLPVLGMSVSARQMPKAMTAFHVSTAEATAPIENQAAAEQAKTVAPAKVEGAAAPAGQLSARAPVDGAILVAPTAVHAAGSSAHQQHLGNGTGQGGQPTTAPMDATAKVDLSPGAATDAVKPQAGAKATALPPTPAQRIAAQIAVRLDKTVVPEGSSRVRLVVSPPELGQITIELTRQGDHLGTRLITRTLEAHALLERLLPDLRQQLEDRGYLMKHLDLAHQGMPDGQGDPRRFAYQRPETHDWMLPPVTREGTEETGDTPRIPHAAIERGLNLTV